MVTHAYFVRTTVRLALAVLIFSPLGTAVPAPVQGAGDVAPKTVDSVSFLGMVSFPTGMMFDGTEVGGLSGMAYDSGRDVFYAVSDDRSEFAPARFYTLQIEIADGALDSGDVTILSVTPLTDATGSTFPERSVDPEGIELTRANHLFVTSEGEANATPPLDPFVNRFDRHGGQTRSLVVPAKFLPSGDGTFGVRHSLAFEGLTASPNRKWLYTATENALAQDGPIASLTHGSPSRILRYRLSSGSPGAEVVYVTDPIPVAPVPPGAFADNGVVALAALDDHGTLLVLERSFAVGQGNNVRLYEASTGGATDVSGTDALNSMADDLPAGITPAAKRLVIDLVDLGLVPDNLEGMAFGPVLPDGRMSLILVSDNNFNPSQTTQFIALGLDVVSAPGVPVTPD